MQNFPKSRQSNLVVQSLGKELLIYDLNSHEAYCLNETARLIFEICDGQRSVTEISVMMSQKLKSNVPHELIWLALDQLKQNDLLVQAEKLEVNFDGLNRRQMIRKIGLATMIAMPIISSLVAPTPIQAASGCVTGVCIKAGQNICAGCTGKTINTLVYTSNDGTCTGASAVGATIVCGGTSISTSKDIKRT